VGVRILIGFYFYPRGGSAHATRATARELAMQGWETTLVSGSRTDLGDVGSAELFFAKAVAAGVRLRSVDFTPATAAENPAITDPGPGGAPMHASFEDRPGAEDPVFAGLGEDELEIQVKAWARELGRAGAADADLLLLHHLTPMHEAAARHFPGVPVVTHIHGSELLMLEAIAEEPDRWPHGEAWRRRLCRWATGSHRLIANGAEGADRAAALLGVPREPILVLPNGFDPEFHPIQVDKSEHWRRNLVSAPQGWSPGHPAGSITYTEEDVERFEDSTVLLYVGRFTEVKRLSLLIEAFAAARERFSCPTALVLLGGYPGEWEGEHPAETIERLGADSVFLAGWHPHEDLPAFFSAVDVLVHPAVREQFGQVIIEAMACEVPPIAVDRGGPSAIVDDGRTGWLVEPDSESELADAMVEAVNDPQERRRRGLAAAGDVGARYAWRAIGAELSAELCEAVRITRAGS